jgi:hypothetical protein
LVAVLLVLAGAGWLVLLVLVRLVKVLFDGWRWWVEGHVNSIGPGAAGW